MKALHCLMMLLVVSHGLAVSHGSVDEDEQSYEVAARAVFEVREYDCNQAFLASRHLTFMVGFPHRLGRARPKECET